MKLTAFLARLLGALSRHRISVNARAEAGNGRRYHQPDPGPSIDLHP